jgi:hypothetical protein
VVGEACAEECVCRINGLRLVVDIGCGRGREEDVKRRRGRNIVDSRYDEGDDGREFPM